MSLVAGSILGSYRIIRLLGKGGMGCVYEVEHVKLRVRRALKVFSSESEHDALLRKRFVAEGCILADLRHPRIVRVYDFAIDEITGILYFAMDLIVSPSGEPQTLEDVCKNGVTEEQVAGWFHDICEGLGYIHSKGVVHRDMSLDNILIDGDGRAVISDFGIAKVTGEEYRRKIGISRTMPLKTGEKYHWGKELYMAPELKAGGEATPVSDAYAFGVILFRLLAGSWYTSETRLEDALAGFDDGWVDVIRGLCNKDPALRSVPELSGTTMICPQCSQTIVYPAALPDGQHVKCPYCMCRFELVDGHVRKLPPKETSAPPVVERLRDPTEKSCWGSTSLVVKVVVSVFEKRLVPVVLIITLGMLLVHMIDACKTPTGDPLPVNPPPPPPLSGPSSSVLEQKAKVELLNLKYQVMKVEAIDGYGGFADEKRKISQEWELLNEKFGGEQFDDVLNGVVILSNRVERLCARDVARRKAFNTLRAVRKLADEVEHLDARKYAPKDWDAAVSVYCEGNNEYLGSHFYEAEKKGEEARHLFENCREATEAAKLQFESLQKNSRMANSTLERIRLKCRTVDDLSMFLFELHGLTNGVVSASVRRTVENEIRRLELMQGFKRWLKSARGFSLKGVDGHKSIKVISFHNGKYVYSFSVKPDQRATIEREGVFSWDAVMTNQDMLFDKILGILCEEKQSLKNMPAPRKRAELLIGGVLVYQMKFPHLPMDAGICLSAMTKAKELDYRYGVEIDRLFRGVEIDPENLVVVETKNLPDQNEIIEPDFYGIPIRVVDIYNEGQIPTIVPSTNNSCVVDFDLKINEGKLALVCDDIKFCPQFSSENDFSVHIVDKTARCIGILEGETEIPSRHSDVKKFIRPGCIWKNDVIARSGCVVGIMDQAGRFAVLKIARVEKGSVCFVFRIYDGNLDVKVR